MKNRKKFLTKVKDIEDTKLLAAYLGVVKTAAVNYCLKHAPEEVIVDGQLKDVTLEGMASFLDSDDAYGDVWS